MGGGGGEIEIGKVKTNLKFIKLFGLFKVLRAREKKYFPRAYLLNLDFNVLLEISLNVLFQKLSFEEIVLFINTALSFTY